ncbi:MAG TPA: cupin domain-containing protein [Dongiaceae bacterium]|nr:cupin domain-containing protein [Dongiaceae bacterium]
MFTKFLRPWRKVAIAAIASAAGIATAATAMAGECPADKIVTDGKGQPMGATEPKDVTDTVLAAIDLSKEKVAADGHQFRMRQLEIQPGGIVPWHSHADRPALIYVVSGEITEYASTCAVPLLHRAGEVSVDAGRSHWWQNTGKKPVVLISADILHDPNDVNM